jgi:hypothetical protein
MSMSVRLPPSLTLPLKGGGDFRRGVGINTPSSLAGEGGVGGTAPMHQDKYDAARPQT